MYKPWFCGIQLKILHLCRDVQCSECKFLCKTLSVHHTRLFNPALQFLHLSRAFTVLLRASAGSSHIHNHRSHSTMSGSWHENSFPSTLNHCFPPCWRDGRASPAHTLPSNFQGNDNSNLESDTIFPLKTRRIFTQKHHIHSIYYFQAAS